MPIAETTSDLEETDVLIIGSGIAGAAVHRSLDNSGLRVATIEAGPAVSAGIAHLRNLLPANDRSWRALVAAVTTAPVQPNVMQPIPEVPAPGAAAGVRADQPPHDLLPGLVSCSAVGGNGLVWSGIVLPPADFDHDIAGPEFEKASIWLGAQITAGAPRQDWLQNTHGLAPVALAWSQQQGWHGPRQLAGTGYSPLASHAALQIIHENGRAVGVDIRCPWTGDRRFWPARQIVLCAGVVGTARLLWQSGLAHQLPGLGRGIAHHPVGFAQLAIPVSAWRAMAQHPAIGRPAAARPPRSPEGRHTIIVTEPPWMPDSRINPCATLSVYTYAKLDIDANRRITFDPEQIGPDGLLLPRFFVPGCAAEQQAERRILEDVRTLATRLGPILPTGRPRILPRGADQHLSGGARMGCAGDPLAVADASGRLHCLENVWLAGAAALPAPVSSHPTLTIVALAARIGTAIGEIMSPRKPLS